MSTYATTVRWADIDANGHARNTTYSEYATDARLRFLAGHGFTVARLHELQIGPVVFTEQLDYRRELRLGDAVDVTVELAGLSPSGHRWIMKHRILRGDTVAATDTLSGSWLDLRTRTLRDPPADLVSAMHALPRADDYRDLPASSSR